jgi:molybdopterin/thiamine biosynthesis adenylyltransferase
MTGIRFAFPTYSDLAANLLDAGGLESCAVAFAHHDAASDTWVVAEVLHTPSDAYWQRDRVSATLTTAFLVAAANRSRALGMAMIVIHTHPDCEGYPDFSLIDDQGEAQYGPYLARRAAAASHMSLVIGPDGCRARRLDDHTEVAVWEVGPELTLCSPLACSPNQLRDDRQIRAFGPEGQRIIRELHFGIIGAGGTGSIIEQQLALLGAQRVTIIDPDEIEATNLNRVVGATPGDVGRPKVEVAAGMMSQVNPDIDVIPIQADIVEADTASRLVGFDFIFLCTDSHASRAVVNQASYQYLVPAVDMGVSITVKDGVITHITGRVKMLAPGLSCLTCTQTLDSEQIRREMLTPGQRAADPYVQGVHEPQPAVISLNSTVASLAMTMMLSAVTSIPSKPRALRYDGISGQTRAMNTTPVEACIVCSAEGALGHGKAWPLPVRPNHTERNAA